ncbi:MAG: YitT family protein [Clostridiales bacterium]|nr:YitT family protein [Clostridiales bacterium]
MKTKGLFGRKEREAIDVRLVLRQQTRQLLFDILGSIFYGIGVYTFAAHANFAPGGITGAAVIINHLFKFPIGTTALLLNIPIVLLSLKYLGGHYLLKTLQTLAVNALLMDVIIPLFPYYTGNPLLAALFGGGFSGIGLALIYNAGSCTGGSDLIIMSMRKLRPHMSLGQITLLIDGSLILLGVPVYGSIDAVLYGVLFTIASTLVIDMMMDGFVGGKMALIISNEHVKIGNAIHSGLNRGATLLRGEGMYTGAERSVMLCACAKQQLPQIRKIVSEHDQDAMLIVLDNREVRGRGFLPHED